MLTLLSPLLSASIGGFNRLEHRVTALRRGERADLPGSLKGEPRRAASHGTSLASADDGGCSRRQTCTVTWTREVGDIGTIIGAVTGAIALTNLTAAFWRRGPGRRRIWAHNFRRLANGVRPAYVEQLFGQPTFAYPHTARAKWEVHGDRVDLKDTWVEQQLTARIWHLGGDGYLMTLSQGDSVIAYSLMTDSRQFHPVVRIGGVGGCDIRLGRTKFSSLSSGAGKWAASMGNRTFNYWEEHLSARPGNDQAWYCCLFWYGGYWERVDGMFNGSAEEGPRAELSDFRAKTAINSVVVAQGRSMSLDLRLGGLGLEQRVQLFHKFGRRDRRQREEAIRRG